jgi:hypothetical protein
MAGKVKTPIIDKNGKQTQVWKNTDTNEGPVRSGVVPIAKAATKYSQHEVLARPPIVLGEDEQYDFTSDEDGISWDGDITRANIYRTEDEDGESVYVATGYGVDIDAKRWLAGNHFDITDEQEAYDFVQKYSGLIDTFFQREYDIDEMEWSDDLIASPVWTLESPEPMSPDTAIDHWDTSDATRIYNESDPGTFGSRDLWRALADEIRATEEVKDYSEQDIAEALESSYGLGKENELRAIVASGRLSGSTGRRIVEQRQLVSNPSAPWDAISEVASSTNDESVQLMAIETGKLPEGALASLRERTIHPSVRDGIDEIIGHNILEGFGA